MDDLAQEPSWLREGDLSQQHQETDESHCLAAIDHKHTAAFFIRRCRFSSLLITYQSNISLAHAGLRLPRQQRLPRQKAWRRTPPLGLYGRRTVLLWRLRQSRRGYGNPTNDVNQSKRRIDHKTIDVIAAPKPRWIPAQPPPERGIE